MYWHRIFVETGNSRLISDFILKDYLTFSERMLKEYFRQKYREAGRFREVGSWCQRGKGETPLEIDIVALTLDGRELEAVEVKRQKKEYDELRFLQKVEILRSKIPQGITIHPKCLTMEDM